MEYMEFYPFNRSWMYTSNSWKRKIKWLRFRFDPVPYTGLKFRGHWFRRPTTYHEIKWNCAHQELEYDLSIPNLVRKKRSFKNIPVSWDDIGRSDVRNKKSWKRHRRHQWK